MRGDGFSSIKHCVEEREVVRAHLNRLAIGGHPVPYSIHSFMGQDEYNGIKYYQVFQVGKVEKPEGKENLFYQHRDRLNEEPLTDKFKKLTLDGIRASLDFVEIQGNNDIMISEGYFGQTLGLYGHCLLYTSPSPRD